MLDDWERRVLEDIERELGRDPSLVCAFASDTGHQRRCRVLLRWLYPGGYLAAAVAWEFAAMGQLRWVVFLSVLLVTLVWLVLEIRAQLSGR